MEEFNGVQEYFHDNDQLKVRTNYKKGKQEGKIEEYYENGQLQYKGNYKDGEQIEMTEEDKPQKRKYLKGG